MTIPTLISSYQKKDTSAKLKKFYSTISQAIKFAEVDHGYSGTWKIPSEFFNDDNEVDYDANRKFVDNFIAQYILPYIKYSKTDDGIYSVDEETGKALTTAIYLNDGTSIEVKHGSCMDFIFDTNADNLPNKYGKDRFYFVLCTTPASQRHFFGNSNQTFGPYINETAEPTFEDLNTREKALQECTESPTSCSFLLQRYDNFEFKDDYLW